MPQSVFKVNDLNKIVKKGRINRNKSVKVIPIDIETFIWGRLVEPIYNLSVF